MNPICYPLYYALMETSRVDFEIAAKYHKQMSLFIVPRDSGVIDTNLRVDLSRMER